MNKLGLRNIILVSLSAALLNLSFVLAQPAQPPANGALTPNFTGLNVTGTSDVGDLNVDGDVQVDGELNVDMGIISGQADLGSLSVNTINSINNNSIRVLKPIEVSQLETDAITSKDTEESVRINDDLYVRDRLQVNNISYLRNTDLNGTLTVDTIEERTNNFGTRFSNDIVVSGQANAQSFAGASGDFGSLNVAGSSIMQFIGSKFYGISSPASTSSNRFVSCLSGDVMINCGGFSSSGNSIKRLYTYGSSGQPDRTCRVIFSSTGSNQKADAICLDL
jgi:hypothetical protein